MNSLHHSGKYDDIIDLPHHVSSRHPHMPMRERAAQFASFKALNGYEEEIEETKRTTSQKIELEEDEKEELDRTLNQIKQHLEVYQNPSPSSSSSLVPPQVKVTWFCPDSQKEGGSYQTCSGLVRKIDTVQRKITLETNITGQEKQEESTILELSLDSILSLEEENPPHESDLQ